MSVTNRWLLPDGVDELLPPEASAAEQLRRTLLDRYASYGYELVSPPLIEYLESLLTGTGNDLDLQTFKVTDQITGRMMGVRADITPQVARIDAHVLKGQHVSRLCYVDTVLHTRPAHMLTNRSPLQIGCELFGERSGQADVEIISLMLDTLRLAGISSIHVDLAHVGIYRGLVESSGLSRQDEALVFFALSRKSIPELELLSHSVSSGQAVLKIIRDIAQMIGGIEPLDTLRPIVQNLTPANTSSVMVAIDELTLVVEQLRKRFDDVEIGLDFCELRGYNYHTGVMFAAYTPGNGNALAKGGRYDDIGKDFGGSRPATGFSADIKSLVRLGKFESRHVKKILAPAVDDAALLEKIDALRTEGYCVVQQFASQDEGDRVCQEALVHDGQQWVVKPLI